MGTAVSPKDKARVGVRVTNAFKEAGVDRGELAERLGIDQSYASRLLQGSFISFHTLRLVAAALGRTPEWLAWGRGDKAPCFEHLPSHYEIPAALTAARAVSLEFPQLAEVIARAFYRLTPPAENPGFLARYYADQIEDLVEEIGVEDKVIAGVKKAADVAKDDPLEVAIALAESMHGIPAERSRAIVEKIGEQEWSERQWLQCLKLAAAEADAA
jgi:transcriptional regulator with XRE-family HTH domain